jgi:hypothetical protein
VIKVDPRATKREIPRKHLSMMEDIPSRKKLRLEVKEAKLKQAKKVNELRRKKASKLEWQEILEIGDTCTVSTQGLKKVHFPYLPVMITAENNKGDFKVYTVASKHGYLREHS